MYSRFTKTSLLFCSLLGFCLFAGEDILPPPAPWSGQSRSLALPANHAWATPFEKEGLKTSPSYDDTVTWLKKLTQASDQLAMIPIGTSLQGRKIYAIIASKEKLFTPVALQSSRKPTLFAHAGIHAGEIDGKDAGMMFLRDLTVTGTRASLLDKTNFIFIPILNPDGHERKSAYNRVNQRGPEIMGWRTNGRNLNLNRDFTKLETKELQALIPFLNLWDPDLYFDIHVTDGVDYQYDITYGFADTSGFSPTSSTWLEKTLVPFVDQKLAQAGHIPGRLIFPADNGDLSKGLVDWAASPRYSNGYGDVRHLPTILVENHSLKPYDQRVLGTYLLLSAAMEVLGDHGNELKKATLVDRNTQRDKIALSFEAGQAKPEMIPFKGIDHKLTDSTITGTKHTQWLGKTIDLQLPILKLNQPKLLVDRPRGYYIPADWSEVIEKLRLHGVEMVPLTEPLEVEVAMYRFSEAKLDTQPFEGRVRVNSAKANLAKTKEVFPAGSVFVSTEQPLGTLVVLLLEPDSADSFWQWGYFHEILQATEYFEEYALEPYAKQVLAKDPELKKAFETKLKEDPAFAADPYARLDFFYQRSPYADKRWMLYPVARTLD